LASLFSEFEYYIAAKNAAQQSTTKRVLADLDNDEVIAFLKYVAVKSSKRESLNDLD
jgi:hypothetical protein